MNRILKTVLLLTWLLAAACVPKTAVAPVPEQAAPGEALFSRAEELFRAGAYQEALAAYGDYLYRHPDQPLAEAALLKTGMAHAALGNYSTARDVYRRLIDGYPKGSFVSEARIEILSTLYHEGKYLKVVEQAASLLKGPVPDVLAVRAHVLVGEAYSALGSPTDAVRSFALAHKNARDFEKEKILKKFKEAVRQLESADIEFLLDRVEDPIAVGHLMYQLGLNLSETEEYEDAEKILKALIANFPRHEDVSQARELLEMIGRRSVYSRYTIGCLFPLSGRYQTYGRRALRGVELALNRFSARNQNSEIRVVVKDTGADPGRAVAAVKELAEENVAAIIGPLVTAESAALEAQYSGIPIITLTQKDDIARVGDYVFRNFITPKMQVKTIASFVIETLGLDSFAILYPDENYGQTFMNLFWDEVIALGGRVVGAEAYNATYTDFADPIKKISGLYYEASEDLKLKMSKALEDATGFEMIGDLLNRSLYPMQEEHLDDPEDQSEPEGEDDKEPQPIVDFDAVFIPDAPAKAGLIIPQLAFYDIRGTYLLGTNLWHSRSLVEMAHQYAQGAIMPDGFFAQSAAPHVKAFARDFEETFGEPPEFIEAVAYDTAMILFELVSRPDVRYRSTLKKELTGLKAYEGVTGQTSFNEQGDVTKRLYLLQIKRDGFVEIGYR